MPVLRVDRANTNEIHKSYINILKKVKVNYIFNGNITESNIGQYGLHMNDSGSIILEKNLISGIRNL